MLRPLRGHLLLSWVMNFMRFGECYRGCWKWKISYWSLRANRCVWTERQIVIIKVFIRPKDCFGLRIIWICCWRLDSLMLPMSAIGMGRNHRFISSFFPSFFITLIIIMVFVVFLEVISITSALVFTWLFLISFSQWQPPSFSLICLFSPLVFEA